jgi:GDP/UDP-N,N'-diacetylbacillosamine 2-epimerase (hydrolysing)
MKKKIIAITGARSEYDLLFSVYKRLDNDDKFDFSLIITGPHLSEKFGNTISQIENDGFKVTMKIFNLIDSNQKVGRIISIGNQISQLANILNHEKPDFVTVAGDREEAISASMVCAYLGIPIIHFFGGDNAKDGNIDNSTRFAASKFAHIHMVTLEEHKQNLIKLGEDEWRIFVVGNPAIDRLVSTPILNKEEVLRYFDFDNIDSKHEYCVLIQHPIITQVEKQREHITETLEGILQSNLHCFVNYPNSDSGFHPIIEVINEFKEKHSDRFTIFKNLERNIFINLLRHSRFLIGNSSAGILEVASLGVAVINVGDRQRGRVHGENVIFTGNNRMEIIEAIEKAITDEEFIKRVHKKSNPYGSGNSSDEIIKIINKLEVTNEIIYKNTTY